MRWLTSSNGITICPENKYEASTTKKRTRIVEVEVVVEVEVEVVVEVGVDVVVGVVGEVAVGVVGVVEVI